MGLTYSGDLDFANQIDFWRIGNLPTNEILIVSPSAHELNLPTEDDLPVVLFQDALNHIYGKHIQREEQFSIEQLKSLPRWIREHVMCFDSTSVPDALVVICDSKDNWGDDIICALHLHKQISADKILVDSVRSVYGKHNLECMINKAVLGGSRFYVNEKTRDWAARRGLQLPKRTAQIFFKQLSTSYHDNQAWCLKLCKVLTKSINWIQRHLNLAAAESARNSASNKSGQG
jgi:hypothetical protein